VEIQRPIITGGCCSSSPALSQNFIHPQQLVALASFSLRSHQSLSLLSRATYPTKILSSRLSLDGHHFFYLIRSSHSAHWNLYFHRHKTSQGTVILYQMAHAACLLTFKLKESLSSQSQLFPAAPSTDLQAIGAHRSSTACRIVGGPHRCPFPPLECSR
jgi:hypothetical protein